MNFGAFYIFIQKYPKLKQPFGMGRVSLEFTLVGSFAVLPACNSVLVCVATFIVGTRFSDAKQFGFYPNRFEQQLVS